MKPAFLILLMFSATAFCQTPEATTWKAWVSAGWKLIQAAEGDLNRDGKSDAVLVIEKDSAANRYPNDGLGTPELNLNPRRLVILFQSIKGYKKVANINRFLPSENDAQTPCLADPLENDSVQVSDGQLKIALTYWLSCGSWGTSRSTFKFRYEQSRFRLIGMDHWAFMRNTGERTESSTNYLTGKKKVITGLNEFEASKPQISWEEARGGRNFYLDTMTSSCDSNGKEEDWCK